MIKNSSMVPVFDTLSLSLLSSEIVRVGAGGIVMHEAESL